MLIHVCELCGYEYNPRLGDEENGIAENTDFEDLLADIADKCAEGEIEFSAEDGEFWKYKFNSETKKWEAHNGVKDYEFSYELKKEGKE